MMKRTAILLVFILGISFLHSCEKDEKEPVLHMDEASSPSITSPASGNTYTLTQEEEDEVLFTFDWAAASYPLENLPDVRYLLQADITANNWENPESIRDITDTRGTSYEITVYQMNQLLTRMGVEPFETGEVSFRVRAFLTTASDHTWLHSDPVDVSITTYESVPEFDILFVPGAHQGWDVGNENTVLYSAEGEDIYEGYLYFPEANNEFKFATELGWDENWGDDGADGTLDPGGANIVAGEAGVYKINVNLNNMTYEFVRTEWGMIGEAAAGWEDDVMMELDTEYFDDTWKVRYTATTSLSAGEFKFRANNDWGINLGAAAGEEELSYDGPNIVVDQAGTYTVILDLSGPSYVYELIAD